MNPVPRLPGGDRGPSPETPALAFLAVSLGVLLAGTLAIWFLLPLLPFRARVQALVAAVALLVILAPLLYVLFIRPMSRGLQGGARVEAALRAACEGLETRVKEHASELEAMNNAFQDEINERRRAMVRLQLQGKLLDAVQQAVMATDNEGAILYWNQFAEELFGWSQDETVGLKLRKLHLFPAENLPLDLADPFTSKGWDGEVPAVRRDGLRFMAFLTCSPMWKADCTVGGLVYTFLDITDRKEAEEAIRNSEEKYSTVVENSPTGICIVQDDKVVFANRRLFEIAAWAPEDLGSIRPSDIIHPEDWPAIEELWRRRFAGEDSAQDFECRILTAGGGIRWFNGRSAVIRIYGKKALLVNVQDVTERRATDQELRASREMLQRLSASLITAQESERKRVAQELHDSLGQSLSAVKFLVERALDSDTAGDHAGSMATVRSILPVIRSAMEEVRRISMALRPSILDDLGLLTTITWFTREFQTTYPDIKVEKTLEIEEAQVPETLKTNIFRILQEAMNNAAKHSRTGRIRIFLKRSEDCLELSIQDEGIGFDPSVERRPDAQGGMGLSSMRERAELFGGSCSITSAPGAGTTVTALWTIQEVLSA